ncbi:hypothetical protein D9M68_927260 [compost metagenome]
MRTGLMGIASSRNAARPILRGAMRQWVARMKSGKSPTAAPGFHPGYDLPACSEMPPYRGPRASRRSTNVDVYSATPGLAARMEMRGVWDET